MPSDLAQPGKRHRLPFSLFATVRLEGERYTRLDSRDDAFKLWNNKYRAFAVFSVIIAYPLLSLLTSLASSDHLLERVPLFFRALAFTYRTLHLFMYFVFFKLLLSAECAPRGDGAGA